MRLLLKQHGAPSSRRRSWSIDAYCGWKPARRGQPSGGARRDEFARFAERSRYRTEAERSQDDSGCDVMWNRPLNTWRQPGFSQTDTHPVVCVTIRDAMAYAEWLSQETGHTYRLPSAAQWQYAARAGSEEAMLHIQGCIPDRMSGTRVHHGNRFGTGGAGRRDHSGRRSFGVQ